jgi:hypothetical protein
MDCRPAFLGGPDHSAAYLDEFKFPSGDETDAEKILEEAEGHFQDLYDGLKALTVYAEARRWHGKWSAWQHILSELDHAKEALRSLDDAIDDVR